MLNSTKFPCALRDGSFSIADSPSSLKFFNQDHVCKLKVNIVFVSGESIGC